MSFFDFKDDAYDELEKTIYFVNPFYRQILDINIQQEKSKYNYSLIQPTNYISVSEYPFIVHFGDSLCNIPSYSGIYIIRNISDEDGFPFIYIGATKNLYRRIAPRDQANNILDVQEKILQRDTDILVSHDKLRSGFIMYFFRVYKGDVFDFEKYLISRYPTNLNKLHTKNRKLYNYEVVKVFSDINDNDLNSTNLSKVVSTYPLFEGNSAYIYQENFEDLVVVDYVCDDKIWLRVTEI
jgi:hypothetical protein